MVVQVQITDLRPAPSITIPLPRISTITRAMASDHGPPLHRAARAIAAVLVAVWAAGLVARDWIQAWPHWGWQPPAWPAGPQWPTGPVPGPKPKPEPVPAAVLQRQAPAAPPVLTRRDACRRLQAQGLSPAKIGRELGVSRSTRRRELMA